MVEVNASTLVKHFNISRSRAKTIMKVISEISDTEDALEVVSELIGGFGVGSANVDDDVLYYVDMGDPYSTTVMYDDSDFKFIIGTWGDWVELKEIEKAEERKAMGLDEGE
ncbi:MAG: hypothetical protein QXT45_06270 [Candidatus Bilamarchaeaceae archaeon]